MKPRVAKVIWRALVLMLALNTVACAEANFELAPESRLPRWLHVPDHLSRSELTVQLDTYSFPVGPVERFKLWDDKGHMLDSINVWREDVMTMRGETAVGSLHYPIHELMTLRGITEIIEFRRMEPWFYLSDDAAIKAKFAARK